jgi:hypothetical protein
MYSTWSLRLALIFFWLKLVMSLVSRPIDEDTVNTLQGVGSKLKDDQVIRYEDRSALEATRIPTIPQCMQ